MDEFAVHKYLKQYYDSFRCFEYCKICSHRNDSHYGNCMECCPVRRGEFIQQDLFQNMETIINGR